MKNGSGWLKVGFFSLALAATGMAVKNFYSVNSGRARSPTSETEPDSTTNDKHPRYPYLGKNAVFLGTSLTAQALYLKPLQIKTGLAKIVNKGISGQFIRTMADQLTFEDLKDAAFVSIEGSTNDYAHGAVAGTITDHDDAHTICGDLSSVVHKIRALNPSIKIFVMNDTLRGSFRDQPVPPEKNENGASLEDISSAMMATAEYLQLAHWDAFHLSGINEHNLKVMTQDNLHWNEAGADLVGKAYGDFINRN